MGLKDDARELAVSFAKHRVAIEEKLKQEPDDDELRDALEDATSAVEVLTTVLDAASPAVPEKDLEENFRSLLEELVEEEAALAEKLEKK